MALKSLRRGSKNKKRTEWRPRGEILIPGNRVEPPTKGRKAKYDRKKNKSPNRDDYD